MFELLAQYHLDESRISADSESFMNLFDQGLKHDDVAVKVAALKATTSFLSSIEDEDIVMKYAGSMEPLLDVVIGVL